MKNKHFRSRLSLLLITTLLLAGIPTPDAYADSLSSLAIYAGEAMAIQGNVVSFNKVSENMPSVNSVVEINTPWDLMDLAKNATIDSYTQNKSFIMTDDLDMTGYSFSSIPTFSGVFDGNGHSITGLKSGDDGYASGLFRYIRHGAVVQNLTVNANIDAVDKKDVTGGICAINEGIISNCIFEGKIQSKTITGGIAAVNEVPGTIMACTNNASIYGYYYTGGITGKNYGVVAYSNNNGNLNNTTEWVEESDAMDPGSDTVSAILSGGTDALNPFNDSSDTTVRTNNGVDTGGIAGYSKGAVYQCKNHATIGYEHTGYNVGGIVGRQAGFVSFCYNYGEIYGRKDIGGIVGQMEPHLTLDDLESLPDAVDKLHDLVDVSLGDIDSSVDAEKIATTGVRSIQLHTGGMCHLDAGMTKQGLEGLGTEDVDLAILENIGNLVCPAEFDTGAVKNAMILSVPEGDDKPLKYPLMFTICDVLLINKIDVLPYFDFSIENCTKYAKRLNPDIKIIPVCARTGEGIDKWADWLREQVSAWKE